MIQEKMIEDMVRQVLQNLTATTIDISLNKSQGLNPEQDYPLAAKRPELINTPTGKGLKDICLEKVASGEITAEDLRITPATLRMQAEIAEGVGRVQFAGNLRRAAELTAVPDQRILEIYNALRPYRSTGQELQGIADELETKYHAKVSATLVREAAEVYQRRGRLRTE